MKHTNSIVAAVAIAAASAPAFAAPDDIIAGAFGRQEQGATLAQVRADLAPHAGDDAIDFALGAIDFLMAGEQLVQRAHRHGFLSTFLAVAPMTGARADFLRWLANDDPEPTTAADVHDAVAEWVEALAAADETLATVDGAFICPIDLPAIRFDINADGKTTAAESLRGLFNLLPPRVRWVGGRRETSSLVPEDLVVAFDRGDAAWLRGYCHILMAVGEWMLAHDGGELFDHTGHVFFPEAKIPFDYLPGSTWSLERMTGMQTPTPFDFTDVIAFFGNMRLPVDEPARMRAVLEHFRAAVDFGREMWSHYDREQDDDREWIPNPKQTAAFHEVQVDADMRDAWLLFLDEADAILHGRKVLRFWRGTGTHGIDVPKVFLEPRDFDLVYWIQGSAAAPFLREGEFTSPGTWAQLQAVFDRRVFRYSFWFN
ncbi:MAG: hypothetical protein ACYTGG_03770 [Planctomycetota bacterium]|jgi:hypothetical protein